MENSNVDRAFQAYQQVSAASKAQKAFDFVAEYKAKHGHRPSLTSIVMLWQEAEAKLAEREAETE